MIKKDLFNDESICIFTDSSFKKYNPKSNVAIGCTAPAYIVYRGDTMIEQGFYILHNSTSQQGELYAMLLGVMASYKYKGFPHIRLFSDNQNAVFSIRQWIFNWVRETSNGKNILGLNGRINNQPFIFDIIYTILSNEIYLELYHVKGHVDIRKYDTVKKSRELFLKSNPFVGNFADDNLIFTLAMGNNAVDEYSTVMLREHFSDAKYQTIGKTPGVVFEYEQPFDIKKYLTLINKDGEKHG